MGGKIIDNAELAEKVKALREQGMTQDQIAVELRIVQSTVSAILRQCGLGGRRAGDEKASAIRHFVRRFLAALAAVSSRRAEKQLSGFSNRHPDAVSFVVVGCRTTLRFFGQKLIRRGEGHRARECPPDGR